MVNPTLRVFLDEDREGPGLLSPSITHLADTGAVAAQDHPGRAGIELGIKAGGDHDTALVGPIALYAAAPFSVNRGAGVVKAEGEVHWYSRSRF